MNLLLKKRLGVDSFSHENPPNTPSEIRNLNHNSLSIATRSPQRIWNGQAEERSRYIDNCAFK